MLEGRKYDGSFINQELSGDGLDIHVIVNGETVDIVSFPNGRTAWEFFDNSGFDDKAVIDSAVIELRDRESGEVLAVR